MRNDAVSEALLRLKLSCLKVGPTGWMGNGKSSSWLFLDRSWRSSDKTGSNQVTQFGSGPVVKKLLEVPD